MKRYGASLLSIALVLGMAKGTSAEIIVHIGLEYVTSYNADYSASQSLEVMTVPTGAAKTIWPIMWPGCEYVNHAFDMSISIEGLAPNQDMVNFMMNKFVSGGVTAAADDYSPYNDAVDPPPMGVDISNAPADSPFSINAFNGIAWLLSVRRGTNTGGLTGNTFGDYAAFAHVGEGAPFVFGQQIINIDGYGEFGFLFKQSGHTFKTISDNTNGAAIDVSAESYPALNTWTAIGDRVALVPEPSTLALLSCGLFGFLACAWRKRK